MSVSANEELRKIALAHAVVSHHASSSAQIVIAAKEFYSFLKEE